MTEIIRTIYIHTFYYEFDYQNKNSYTNRIVFFLTYQVRGQSSARILTNFWTDEVANKLTSFTKTDARKDGASSNQDPDGSCLALMANRRAAMFASLEY